jgi:drug/metabolite transporter (DMT)-like permease
VLIKIGLADIPPLIFAGLRYSLGAVVLLAFYACSSKKVDPRTVNRSTWILLVIYGIVYFTAGQGTTFISLNYLPAVTTNLILSIIPIIVALFSVFFTKESPSMLQWAGIALCLIGILAYFLPVTVIPSQAPGLIAGGFGVLVNAMASIMGRNLNREGKFPALWITMVSMVIGAPILLAIGLILDPFPILNLKTGLMIIWLAVINTAFAFTLLNHTLRTLTAVESSMINTLMTVEIPLLAICFLGEKMTLKEVTGMALAVAGILLVQISAARRVRVSRSDI